MKKNKLLHLAILSCATLIHCAANAAEPPADDIVSRALARQLVDETIALVEKNSLGPLNEVAYEKARQALADELAKDVPGFDRAKLYAAIQSLLNTLDSDRHSSLRSLRTSTKAYKMYQAPPPDFSAVARVIETPGGKVLHFTPPQITGGTPESRINYVTGVLKAVIDYPAAAFSCAVVVDLTKQLGGNAWPPLIALQPLLTSQNSARFVARSGYRMPLFTMPSLEAMAANAAPGVANPLKRFAGQRIAVVMDKNTSSAGEMLAMALMGEAQSRSFGWETYGLTTANMSYPMPDQAMLILSVSRYALGDQMPIRGKIAPTVPAGKDATLPQVLQSAADWAASQSSLCGKQGRAH